MQELRAEIAKQIGHELPPGFEFNGEFKHWRSDGSNSKNPHFWAIGYTWDYKGNEHQTVIYGSFREDTRFQATSYDLKNQSKTFQKAHNAAIDTINKKAQDEKESKHKMCVQKWEPIYLDAPPATGHPYLERKKIEAGRACVDKYHNLLVPIQDINDTFTGVQIIKQDGQKLFATGTKIQACFHSVTSDDLSKVQLVYLCEGYATGMTIHAAVGGQVVCAMNCGNLLPVAKALRAMNPELRIVLCADDDRETKGNPGRKKAEEVARKINNVLLRFPKFTVNDSRLSDFNDLHVAESLVQVTDQLAFTPSDFVDIIPYGYEGKQFYYYSTQTLKLENFTASEHSKQHLLSIARESYWTQKFPSAMGERGLDYTKVAEELFELQRNKGHFNPADVRGTGAWIDQGRPIFNLGKFILDQGRQIPIQNFHADSKFLYEASSIQSFDPDQQVTPTETQQIVDCFKLLSYKNDQDHINLVGWLICAHVCGALDWRPHLWLTGPKASGKSTILSMISQLLNGVPIDRGTTEAGVRQKLKTNSRAVIYDEAEPNTKKDRIRMDGLMELIRQSSSRADNGHIVKGSSGGQAQVFKINSCFLLASIQTSLEIGADQSRFTVIEMLDTRTQPRSTYAKIKELSANFDILGPKLAAFCATNLPQIHAKIKEAAAYMALHHTFSEQRQIDQYAALIGAFSFISGTPISQCVPTLTHDTTDTPGEDDAQACLEAILETSDRAGRSIGMMLEDISGCFKNELAIYGIKRIDKERIFIASNNLNLSASLDRTQFKNYASLLRRGATFVSNGTRKLNSIDKKGIVLNLAGGALKIHEGQNSFGENDDAPY